MIYAETYHGFASQERLILKGRLLSDPIFIPSSTDTGNPLLDNIRRFLSREKKNYPLEIQICGVTYPLETDDEGYYTLEISKPEKIEGKIIEAKVLGNQIHETYHKVFVSNEHAEYGIISDIDDTILHTEVSSILRMLYLSFFKTPWQRESVKNASDWFSRLNNDGRNPIFYISHSPWNIYQNIISFLRISKFPPGPVFLRDYGFYLFKKPVNYTDHKKIYIKKILEYHPDLPFIMIGDAAEMDAEIYSHFLTSSPERIKHIYIRRGPDMLQDLSIYESHPKLTIINNFDRDL